MKHVNTAVNINYYTLTYIILCPLPVQPNIDDPPRLPCDVTVIETRHPLEF